MIEATKVAGVVAAKNKDVVMTLAVVVVVVLCARVVVAMATRNASDLTMLSLGAPMVLACRDDVVVLETTAQGPRDVYICLVGPAFLGVYGLLNNARRMATVEECTFVTSWGAWLSVSRLGAFSEVRLSLSSYRVTEARGINMNALRIPVTSTVL